MIHWPTRLAVIPLVMIGIGLCFQPLRFQRTPSYANLLNIAPAQAWGALYLIVAVLLVSWMVRRAPQWWGIAVHTIAVMLTAGWLGAFIVRWLTDDATTIVNVASWTVFLSLVIKSSLNIVDKPPA
jgi:ABC-type proline/glycine betaine transport system permease subunit